MTETPGNSPRTGLSSGRGASAQPFPLEPSPIHVAEDVLIDLRRRLELTRFPVDAGNEDWYYGVNRAYLAELVDYWYRLRLARGRGGDQRL
jgi:hypothetical protein